MARSVTSETKAKFEALLKAALKKTNSKSTQNLIEKTRYDGEDNNANEEIELNENVDNFILNKFLNDDVTEVVEKPVPKVRKKLLQQKSSESEKSSGKSDRTFIVEKNENEEIVKEHAIGASTSSSQSSRRTYNVNKEEIGDIVFHDGKQRVQILKLKTNRTNSSASNTENEEIELDELKSKSVCSEAEKSDKDDEKTRITYETEVKKNKKKVRPKEIDEEITCVVEGGDKTEEDKITTITIHRTDRLKLNRFIVHPLVKIHIVNYETGEYIKKTNPERAGVLNVENNVNFLMPVMTQNFNLQDKRQFYPEWEETIIINESYEYLIEEKTKTMFFFELLDFINFDDLQQKGNSNGYHNIAWAFLKIVAGDGTTNTNKTSRLQLYKPNSIKKGSFCYVYDWWKQKRIKYPSTLYVTIKGILSPKTITEAFRPKTPLQSEIGLKSSLKQKEYDLNDDEEEDIAEKDKEKIRTVLENLQENAFKLPNKLHAELNSGDEGCFALKFGNTGKYLACGVSLKDVYTLKIYLLPEVEEFFKLNAHQGLIYNIVFSKDDSLIISSSADGTVSIWDLNKVKFLQMLPHPSYVYWCEINKNLIVTGCFDKTVRIWKQSENQNWELFEELEAHNGYITCVCVNSNTSYIYSSDSIGTIIVWKQTNDKWNLYKNITLTELDNTIINAILLHRKEKRLIIHARDNIIRILDIKNECVINWLERGINNRVRTTCCFSPCNTYVFSGSENGCMNVYNIETGQITAIYEPYTKLAMTRLPVHSLDVCKKTKMLAFSHFGHKIPIILYSVDPITTDVEMTTFDVQKKWKQTVQKTRIQKSADLIPSGDKSVNLKEILDKIDRIIT